MNETGIDHQADKDRLTEATDHMPPLDVNHELQTKDDWNRMKRNFWRMQGWHACVGWSLPIELIKVLVFPEYLLLRTTAPGLGMPMT